MNGSEPLSANPDSQTAFSTMKAALAGAAPTDQYPLYTTTGEVGPFAASDLIAALASYGAALLPRELASGTGFNSRYFAALAATTFADLDAIPIG